MSISSPIFAQPHPMLHRIEALQQGKLNTNEIVLLCQDVIEAGEIHVSLWKAIADMHAAGEPKGRIAEFLGRHGL